MNTLFAEEKSVVNFNVSAKLAAGRNFVEYYIGIEHGVLKTYRPKDFTGYEFFSDSGKVYFISTNKTNYPKTYDAVFSIDEKQQERSYTSKQLSKTKKKLLFVKLPSTNDIISSWKHAFSYKQEIRDEQANIQTYGLRPPQIGALHAIQAHWSISKKAALIVMPTGTGKTETMLSLSVAEGCQGMLIVVPSSSLRTQLFKKFRSLGILKSAPFHIVDQKALNPLVGFMQTGIKTIDDANLLFASNVIVTTPQLITGILEGNPDIKSKLLKWCNYLVMDEAHHSSAKEWNRIKIEFEMLGKAILLFTATPFRNDKKRLQGKMIYDYPLSLAQKDQYFKPINFYPIIEFNPKISDRKIADKAVELLRQQILDGYDHILMARVDTQKKAEEVFEEIYKSYQDLNPVFIHSGVSTTDKKRILEEIKAGQHKVIVCVDMLGEGFDLPQLKVCALHDLHKNITTSFQFFGRFTRESNLKLGNATIVANIVDPNLKGTLKKLYQKDSDWDKIISQTNENLVSDVADEENFFKNFSDVEIPAKIPLRNITPAMSTVVYRLYDDSKWEPENYKSQFNPEKYETVSVEHEEEKLLVIIARKVEPVKWGKIDDLLNVDYELYLIYLNSDQKLLYINSTNNSTTHHDLAETIVGKNISLFNEAEIYKCLDNIFQVELFNLGLRSNLEGPISFTMYAGNGIVSGLDELDKDGKSSSNLFGVGYENGEKISIGCSSKGRVWTKLVKTIPDFCVWCDQLGNKLLDPNIDAKDIFSFIQKPERIVALPSGKVPVSIKWSEELYAHIQMVTYSGFPVVDCIIELLGFDQYSVHFAIKTDSQVSAYKLILEDQPQGRGYRYELISGAAIVVIFRGDNKEIADLFYEFPPVIWFHENSKLYNNIFFPFKGKIDLFNPDKILTQSWVGVSIQKESQKQVKRPDSIQYRMIQNLLADDDCKIVFDDDDANEAGDIIAFKFWGNGDSRLVCEIFHCKFSSEKNPGARLKDLYEVCGQAQRSFHWKHHMMELINHMVRRQNARQDSGKNSRFEKGGDNEMKMLTNMLTSGYCKLETNIYVVQPGLSKKAINAEKGHLTLLGATDLLLKKTGNGFFVIAAD